MASDQPRLTPDADALGSAPAAGSAHGTGSALDAVDPGAAVALVNEGQLLTLAVQINQILTAAHLNEADEDDVTAAVIEDIRSFIRMHRHYPDISPTLSRLAGSESCL